MEENQISFVTLVVNSALLKFFVGLLFNNSKSYGHGNNQEKA